jgi:predicted nucleic acid-binding protein
MGGKVACIVTGDKDLLELERYRGIPILDPERFWRFEDEY